MAKYQTNKTKRAVYNTLRCIGVMLFGQNRFKQPKFLENAAQKDKYEVWLGMIDEGKINEVENELIEETEQRRPDMHPSESEKMASLRWLCRYISISTTKMMLFWRGLPTAEKKLKRAF